MLIKKFSCTFIFYIYYYIYCYFITSDRFISKKLYEFYNLAHVSHTCLVPSTQSGPGRGSWGPGKNFFVGPFLSIF